MFYEQDLFKISAALSSHTLHLQICVLLFFMVGPFPWFVFPTGAINLSDLDTGLILGCGSK